MKVINSSKEFDLISFDSPVAFVPTMGNLHEGHLTLVRYAKKNYSDVITSIFVNPLQFGKNEDFSSYPKTLTHDKELLENLNCDYLFLPEDNFAENLISIKPKFADVLCGISRPVHFQGVLTIIDKFIKVIKPDVCLFGLKDYQQQLIIKDYVNTKKIRTKIISLPTVREKSGLAMSSRNNYLSPSERKHCGKIFACIENLSKNLRDSKTLSTVESLKTKGLIHLKENDFEIDYLEILDADDLSFVTKKTMNFLIAVAVKYRKVRLIDNIVVSL